MSIEYLNFAFKSRIRKSSTKFVFVALADYANEVGEAYPSIETMCNKTSLNRKTVINALKDLRDIGVISDTNQNRGHTRQVKVWQLHMLESMLQGDVLEHGNSTKNGTVPNLPDNSTENGTVKPSQNRDIEPSDPLTTIHPSDIPSFQQFYDRYNNKKKRVEAERAWSKLSDSEKAAAYEAIPAFDKTIPDYHDKPYPASYLNAKRWDDDMTPWVNPKQQKQDQEQQNNKLILPRSDEELEPYARKHGLPRPSAGETYAQYRQKLTRFIERELQSRASKQ